MSEAATEQVNASSVKPKVVPKRAEKATQTKIADVAPPAEPKAIEPPADAEGSVTDPPAEPTQANIADVEPPSSEPPAPPPSPAVNEEPAAQVEERLAVKCLKDFRMGVNGSYMSFTRGQVIGDYQRAKYLLEKNAPVVPVDGTEYSLCENCGHIQKRG